MNITERLGAFRSLFYFFLKVRSQTNIEDFRETVAFIKDSLRPLNLIRKQVLIFETVLICFEKSRILQHFLKIKQSFHAIL